MWPLESSPSWQSWHICSNTEPSQPQPPTASGVTEVRRVWLKGTQTCPGEGSLFYNPIFRKESWPNNQHLGGFWRAEPCFLIAFVDIQVDLVPNRQWVPKVPKEPHISLTISYMSTSREWLPESQDSIFLPFEALSIPRVVLAVE